MVLTKVTQEKERMIQEAKKQATIASAFATSVIRNNDPEPFELQQQPYFQWDCEDEACGPTIPSSPNLSSSSLSSTWTRSILHSKSVQMVHTATQIDIYIPKDIPVFGSNAIAKVRKPQCFRGCYSYPHS